MLTLTKTTSIIILTLTNARRKTKFSDKEHIFLIFFFFQIKYCRIYKVPRQMQRTIPKNSFKSFNLAPLVREY